ncbi:hypothetical protein QTA56_03600 [Acinetobacter sp. VNH17]|uniref:Uncharacterized protein n=1 Tax=Acinetobacter thutiue TaxID=2998078 RepID=A0ABT7WKW9_9GAMM|nr:ABC-three component system middle component 2 [Acinetobacter thutiue]MCY6411224.1 hypothetical protein [Acinetobacter thutiue]MDN0013326.1 hypothetical protein [Acinetobacter thutiue]
MKIYNTPTELGIRASILLNYISPNYATINKISYLDYIAIYSKNYTGIESLHPEVPMHQMEFLLRYEALKSGLIQMIKKGIVNTEILNNEIHYKKGENTFSFIHLLDNKYHTDLIVKCQIVAERFGHLNENELYELILSSEVLGK